MADFYIDENIKNYIKNLEGYSPTAYQDATGHSIGYGHFIKPGEEHLLKESINVTQAEQLLEEDIKSHQSRWLGELKNKDPMVIKALTSFAYNVGPYASATVQAVKKLNEGDKPGAIAIMAQYNKSRDAEGVLAFNPQLAKRRAYEASLIDGSAPSQGIAGLFGVKEGSVVDKLLDVVVPFRKKGPLDYYNEIFQVSTAKKVGLACSTADTSNINADILKELTAMNNSYAAKESAEEEWLTKLKQEGGGDLTAAGGARWAVQ